ncbi:MAG: saccharopine dehydrogenase NADP-binding domain-containing protein [Polyangiaceae bacterium]
MTVVVYGATGWTGTKVAHALARRGVDLVVAGRSRGALERLARELPGETAVAIAPLDDKRALYFAVAGAQALVNCAGPCVESGPPLIEACLEARADYMDVSGEASYVDDVYGHYHGRAMRRGVTLCPAFAAKGALGDWGAQLVAADLGAPHELDDVGVAYAHGRREYFRPSVASVVSSAGQGFFHGGGLALRRLIVEREFAFPPPFGAGLALRVPAAEDRSIRRHLRVREVGTYIALAPGDAINRPWAKLSRAALPIMPWISRTLFSEWGRWHLRLYLPKPEASHGEDSFGVTVEARSGRNTGCIGLVTHDAYASTAEIVALGVLRLLEGGRLEPGALAPSELCDPASAVRELERIGALRVYHYDHSHGGDYG